MSKFRDLIKSILKEAGNYPDDFNSAAFDNMWDSGSDPLDKSYLLIVTDGIINSAKDPEGEELSSPFDVKNYLEQNPDSPKFMIYDKGILFDAREYMEEIMEDREYIPTFHAYTSKDPSPREQANKALEDAQKVNPNATFKLVEINEYIDDDYEFDPADESYPTHWKIEF